MVPFSLSASVAGLIGLAIETSKILGGFVADVKNAPDDARTLHMEITAFCQVLEKLVTFLRNEDLKGISFDETSALCSIISSCEEQIQGLYKKLGQRSATTSRIGGIIERIKWPFQKEDFEATVPSITRFTQVFQFSLTIDNWLSFL
ncbi:hypothetical protein FPQ18DRAFT_418713 [Pyronema domesticum]|uniref:Azaphilone pigments biosynthesis cluster protein L N-terminal domain-containing protein n=1 Tax=Pyronema omphalodes (strain CBS 100304) TaxID=1076935 RepID=U4LHH7_PYROM|nr:hypothetical protein FPQ18DRAFT_418713 [Pyronema domesticum]CCX31584.1 Similar to conserved hypothetical protein [Arthroderma otae CBS 113480]; acc. no. XP_002847693 [Pyronema omphalodes CBS 100304]